MYEYVSESEYLPFKSEIEKIIGKVRRIMRDKHNILFRYQLIGADNRFLITRLEGSDGFYFDYNLILPPRSDGEKYSAYEVNRQFFMAFRYALKNTVYRIVKDDAAVLSARNSDTENSGGLKGCDFSVVYEDADHGGYHYLYRDRNDIYSFRYRANHNRINEMVDRICQKHEQGWELVREEYLKLRDINEGNEKRPFPLFIEAVSNIHNSLVLNSGEPESGGTAAPDFAGA